MLSINEIMAATWSNFCLLFATNVVLMCALVVQFAVL